MESVPLIHARNPEATAGVTFEASKRLGTVQRHRWWPLEVAIDISSVHDQTLALLFMDKETRAMELRCPRVTHKPLPKECADERLVGQTGSPPAFFPDRAAEARS